MGVAKRRRKCTRLHDRELSAWAMQPKIAANERENDETPRALTLGVVR
jgi:hypothetical protein